jgi:hypothetical protein
MHQNKRSSPLLIGSISALLFVLAVRIHHPLLIVIAVISIGITYVRFQNNYIQYRRRQAKLKRRSGVIEVESSELKETEDHHV